MNSPSDVVATGVAGATPLPLAASLDATPEEFRGRRILFVAPEDWFFAAQVLPVARTLRAAGAEVGVLAPCGPAAATLRAGGFIVFPWRMDRKSTNPFREFPSFVQLVRTLRRFRPDLVHAVSLKQAVYAGLLGKLLRIPTLNYITGLGYLFAADSRRMRMLRRFVLYLLRQSKCNPLARVAVENDDDREELIRAGAIDRSRSTIIRGGGVDTDFFLPQPEPEGVPVVVLASRLLWYKGVGEFVQAAELLQRQGVVARFALVGNGDPSNRSCVPAEQLERWQRAGTVELWGHQTDMRRVYAQAHVVCLPTFYREGIPKVLLEAAAAGRPIVTTASPGCRDIVHHQVNGLLVRRHDVAGLAAALRSLIENRALRLNFGARGRERALSEFRKELVIAANLALYRELLPAWELGDGFAANRQQF